MMKSQLLRTSSCFDPEGYFPKRIDGSSVLKEGIQE
uniref:Uncharacterized protein MANES_15G022100 n=1 Tax=Rhizophora mucronata TaxID=61149 RepID=A0A2P2LGA6_RHIMU